MRVLFLFFILSSMTPIKTKPSAAPKQTDIVYLHAYAGSFCHRALNKLVGKETLFDERIFFCPSLYETLHSAYLKNGYAFVKLYEDPDRVVDPECVKAFQSFQIQHIASLLRIKNNIHLYKHKKGTNRLTKIASHPHLLKKIQKYIKKHHLSTIEVPGGSDEAAQLLSSNEFDFSTAVAGSSLIGKVFPDLTFYEKNIQDHHHSFDIYALVKVSKREKKVGLDCAKKEVLSLTAQLDPSLEKNHQILIFSKDLFFHKQILDKEPHTPHLLQ